MDPFEKALGGSFGSLPAAVQAFHRAGNSKFTGYATIDRGHSLLGKIMLKAGGFPPSGQDVPVTVTVETVDNGQRWTRNFAGHIMRSTLRYTGTKRELEESFGPITLHMSLTATPDGLHIGIAKITLFRWLKMPGFLLPNSTSSETQDAKGRFRFFIKATAPMAGLLIEYHGHLEGQ